MSELEVTVKYDSLPAKIGLYSVLLLFPAWGVLAPIAFGIYVYVGIAFGYTALGLHSWITWLGIILGWILLFAMGAAATIFFADNRVRISKDSVWLPLFLSPLSNKRRHFGWSDLAKIDLVKGDSTQIPRLVFYLKKGGTRALKIAGIPKDQLEQMLVAIDVWSGATEKGPELIELQGQLQGKTDSNGPSYTAMWEDELASRFAATSFTPLAPDTILQQGRIKVVRQLSFGGLSAIYLCQIDNKELAVLKEAVIPAGTKDSIKEKSLELFQREASFLMKLNHPAIVRVLDHFVENNRNYLLLEYINGQDLRQFVKQNGGRNEWTTLNWGRQIAEILNYMHNQSPPMIHRDISPDNIVLREDESLTLIDFGAANEFVGTVTGTLVGKQSFIAPEQFRGRSVVQSDLYALGCTLFFLLIAEEPEALSTSHPKTLKDTLSDEIDKLVADLTELEVDDRIHSAAQVLARIDEILAARRDGQAALTPSLH